MYEYFAIPDLIDTANEAVTYPIKSHGVLVYVETNPDDVSPDIYIDPLDTEGIAIFREFAARMAVHYKTLKEKS